jgi:hypothetical protein
MKEDSAGSVKKSNCCNGNVSGYKTERGCETIEHSAASGWGI